MKLSQGALLAVRGLDTEKKKELAAVYPVTLVSLNRWLKSNDDKLTQASGLNKIILLTELPYEIVISSIPSASPVTF